MPIQTEFLRLREAVAWGYEMDGCQVCWLGGWDKHRMFYRDGDEDTDCCKEEGGNGAAGPGRGIVVAWAEAKMLARTVYRAMDLTLGQTVTLKLLAKAVASVPTLIRHTVRRRHVHQQTTPCCRANVSPRTLFERICTMGQ